MAADAQRAEAARLTAPAGASVGEVEQLKAQLAEARRQIQADAKQLAEMRAEQDRARAELGACRLTSAWLRQQKDVVVRQHVGLTFAGLDALLIVLEELGVPAALARFNVL